LKRTVLSFLSDESGATAIEYGLIVSLISVTILGTLVILGANLRDKAMVIADAIAEAGR